MSKLLLRVGRCFFLGSAMLAGLKWIETADRLDAVKESIIIQPGKTSSVTFTPKLAYTT